jgi:beta-galactosidase
VTVIGDWCNGSTNASGAFCLGSNPRSPVFPLFLIVLMACCNGRLAAVPPAVWDLAKAQHEATATRERVCINGLWRWQPGKGEAAAPEGGWGFFKVPGAWPGISDYMQKDCQTVWIDPSWKDVNLGGINSAWYQREIEIPKEWAGRKIALSLEYLNSHAAVYVDGKKAGEILFPAGEIDLTSACQPGQKHILSLLVTAMPLKGVLLSYTDSASAREVKGAVARRGLCGDVYLIGRPSAGRIENVAVETSVRNGEIKISASLIGTTAPCSIRAKAVRGGRVETEFKSPAFKAGDEKISFTQKWKPDRLWDIHTPQNVYELQVELVDEAGKVIDAAWPVQFGFREFWIDGKDFYLNGSRIFISAVPLDNAEVSAELATYERVRQSLRRLKSFGINFVYTHNYGCEPGSHLSFEEVLRAADDEGMLVSLSQPHFSHYEWKAPDADENNGYAKHAEFYVGVARNHPSVVTYSMSHNATGYEEDMNPDMIDGLKDPRAGNEWSGRNAKLALRAEAIVKKLDASRIVYHHASGNLGSMHVMNYYANMVPIQEQSDWFEHWSKVGVKPVFMCEYGVPFTWDWTMYRGWYKGQREFGSAKVPWEFCLAEWNSQFVGDKAFDISEAEKANLRWEAKQLKAGNTWHRWDYPNQVGSSRFEERYPIFAMYIEDNWRAFRTLGVSGNSPWEHEHFWKLREGVDKRRKELKVDWEKLQRPGFSADYEDQRYERMDLAYEKSDWIATEAAKALIRNNGPLLAYIGGKESAVTGKDHNFVPGEMVEKQLIVINNSRESDKAECKWSVSLPEPKSGEKQIEIATGEQQRIPIQINLPAGVKAGVYQLSASVRFGSGEVQEDQFAIHVVPNPQRAKVNSRIALFDPQGDSSRLLKELGIQFETVEASSDLTGFDVLIVGKGAMSLDGAAPAIGRVRDGLKVIIFEQTGEVLEKRFGFRVAEYGLRWVFKRVADHPLLAELDEEHLKNWRGEATILPPRLSYEIRPRYGPTVQWCGIPVPRIWRCGNRGNVASVLIEKPARGDFQPILDGGFGLQYATLMEYREGKGMVLFCQMDVSGRSENDPAAETLAANIVRYVDGWKPTPRRTALYVGEEAGKKHLKLDSYEGRDLSNDRVLVVGPGGGEKLAANAPAIEKFLKGGGNLLAIGLDEREANSFLPFKVTTNRSEHIAARFEPFANGSLLGGVSPADVHNRDPRQMPLLSGGATIFGDGVLARAEKYNVVFCQIIPWQFEPVGQMNMKRTYRRASALVNQLIGNMGVETATPLLERFSKPVALPAAEKRWLEGFYLDTPEEWDDPYRFFRW